LFISDQSERNINFSFVDQMDFISMNGMQVNFSQVENIKAESCIRANSFSLQPQWNSQFVSCDLKIHCFCCCPRNSWSVSDHRFALRRRPNFSASWINNKFWINKIRIFVIPLNYCERKK